MNRKRPARPAQPKVPTALDVLDLIVDTVCGRPRGNEWDQYATLVGTHTAEHGSIWLTVDLIDSSGRKAGIYRAGFERIEGWPEPGMDDFGAIESTIVPADLEPYSGPDDE